MQGKELRQRTLGLKSLWSITEVRLDVENQQVDVLVAHPEEPRSECPNCGQVLASYDYARPASFAHPLASRQDA